MSQAKDCPTRPEDTPLPEGSAVASSALRVLCVANLVSAALSAGAQVAALVVIAPQRHEYPPGTAVLLHQRATPRIDRYVPAAALATVVTSLPLVRRGPRPWSALAVPAGLGTIAMALGFGMPLDRRIASWSADAPPADHAAVFRRWDRIHAVRTGCAVTAFVCSAIAATAERKDCP